MERETRILWAVAAVVILLAILFTFGGKVQQELSPEPQAAWVAIAAGDDPVAVSGPVELTAGETFTLHAVLEARTWRGETVYYTEAQRLRLGGEEVAQSALRRWPGGEPIKVLWFVVEGTPPFLEAGAPGDLERLQFRESFRAEWPHTWSVPGSVEPSRRRLAVGEVYGGFPEFGRQMYHVRIEFFGPASSVVPRLRMSSWGAADVEGESARFPAVTVRLPDRLAAASAVFGTAQLELSETAGSEVAERVGELWQRHLAFSRLLVLRRHLEAAGVSWEELDWRSVDLTKGPEWGIGGAAAGDILQVGERFVILASDEGRPGRLDRDDLGFDFDKGAVLRRLGEVFTGQGLVEWAPLGAAG